MTESPYALSSYSSLATEPLQQIAGQVVNILQDGTGVGIADGQPVVF
ncbi:hypothetical protein [Xenorhabdus khoisanae]